MKFEKTKLIAIVLFFVIATTFAIIRILSRGLNYEDFLMVYGVCLMTIVLLCMTWPEHAQKIVQKNSKPIYMVFMLIMTPLVGVLVVGAAMVAVKTCCSWDNTVSPLAIVFGGTAMLLILSTEIISYKVLLAKIKKAVRI